MPSQTYCIKPFQISPPPPSRSSSIRPTLPTDPSITTCAICFEALFVPPFASPAATTTLETPVVIIACGHTFGRTCLAQWMKSANTCPLCRIEFFEKEKGEVPEWVRMAYMGSVFVMPGDWYYTGGGGTRAMEDVRVSVREIMGSDSEESGGDGLGGVVEGRMGGRKREGVRGVVRRYFA